MRDERGMTGSVQVTLLFPLLFFVLLLALQWALFSWGQATALAAAQDAARAASARGASGADGEAAALASTGNGSLREVGIRVRTGARTVDVTVSGEAISVIPGWAPVVTQYVQLPLERVTTS